MFQKKKAYSHAKLLTHYSQVSFKKYDYLCSIFRLRQLKEIHWILNEMLFKLLIMKLKSGYLIINQFIHQKNYQKR